MNNVSVAMLLAAGKVKSLWMLVEAKFPARTNVEGVLLTASYIPSRILHVRQSVVLIDAVDRVPMQSSRREDARRANRTARMRIGRWEITELADMQCSIGCSGNVGTKSRASSRVVPVVSLRLFSQTRDEDRHWNRSPRSALR